MPTISTSWSEQLRHDRNTKCSDSPDILTASSLSRYAGAPQVSQLYRDRPRIATEILAELTRNRHT